jgi:multidrug efflux system outer membrane protein
VRFGVASGNLSELFNSSSKVWQYGGSLGLPIFTAGLLAGQVQVAESQQQQALFAYQKAVQDAFRGVNDALIDQDRTRVQLAAQRQQVDSLTRYSDTAQLRYDNGYTSYLEVVDAQRSLFNAQLSYTQTQQTLASGFDQSVQGDGRGLGGGGRKARHIRGRERRDIAYQVIPANARTCRRFRMGSQSDS